MINDKNQQLNILSDENPIENPPECDTASDIVLKVYIDGAARNNPGPSGSGICIKRGNEIVFEQGFFIGNRTNNQAEYFALLISIFFIKQYHKKNELVLIYSDSQLLVRQMLGVYKVRDTFL